MGEEGMVTNIMKVVVTLFSKRRSFRVTFLMKVVLEYILTSLELKALALSSPLRQVMLLWKEPLATADLQLKEAACCLVPEAGKKVVAAMFEARPTKLKTELLALFLLTGEFMLMLSISLMRELVA